MKRATKTCCLRGSLFCRRLFLIIISLVFISIQIMAQNGWTKKADMPTLRAGASASVVDSKIYVIGGTNTSSTDLAVNEAYDPLTNTWETKAHMPTARGFLLTCVVNDTIYAVGGGYPTSKKVVEAYDPATNTWVSKASMPSPWIGVYGDVVDDKIYTMGGKYNQRNCFEYNTPKNAWIEKTSIPDGGGGALSATAYNGSIYIFGGSTYSPWAAKKTVYAYNPQTDTWTQKKDMPTPRFALRTFLVDGKIYALGGGQYDGNCLSTLEVYDPTTDTWEKKSDMPINTAWFAGAVVNNKIYVFGKIATGWSTGWPEVWEYDPSLDTFKEAWTNKSDLPKGGGTASVVNGKIYVMGGSSMPAIADVPYNVVYDPSTNTWTEKKQMPTARGFLTSAVVDNKIYAIGGGYPNSTNKNEVYDPATDTWTTKGNMLNNRLGMQAAAVDGKIYIFGGNYNERNCQAYDPVADTWTEKQPIPTGGGVGSVTAYNGLIYIFGGSTYSPWNALSKVYAYNPQTDTYTLKKDMPTARFAFQTYLIGGKIYAIGGSGHENYALASVEVYDPATDSWEIKPNMKKNLAWFAGAVVNNKIYVIGGTKDWGTTGNYEIWEYDPALDITGVEKELTTPTNFELYQNYPNPFNPTTAISYQLSAFSHVSLKIYDILGKEIATLLNEEKSAGTYEVKWNAANMPSGVYFYQLKAGGFTATKKLLLLK